MAKKEPVLSIDLSLIVALGAVCAAAVILLLKYRKPKNRKE